MQRRNTRWLPPSSKPKVRLGVLEVHSELGVLRISRNDGLPAELLQEFMVHGGQRFRGKLYSFNYYVALCCSYNFQMGDRYNLFRGAPRRPMAGAGAGGDFLEVPAQPLASPSCSQ